MRRQAAWMANKILVIIPREIVSISLRHPLGIQKYFSGDYRKASPIPFEKIDRYSPAAAIGGPTIRVETISSDIFPTSTNNVATFCSSSLRISEESNVQSVAVAVSTLEAETHEFLLSRSDPPFIDAFGHEEDF